MRIKQIESLLREKDYRYFYQQKTLDEITDELGVVVFHPNYHGNYKEESKIG